MTSPDTPLAELIGYLLAASLLVVVGAFFRGPILTFTAGPGCVVACVWLCAAIKPQLRS